MGVICKMVFIDESGAGTIKQDKNSLWITAGVLSALDMHGTLTDNFQDTKNGLMRNPDEEFKAASFRSTCLPGRPPMTLHTRFLNL